MLDFNFSFNVPSKNFFEALGSFEGGTRIAILGPSGCGKTTFLKSLVGLAPKKSGKISWMNQGIDQKLLNEGILGFCFQSSPLFSHLNVLQNLILPLETLKSFQPFSKELKEEKALMLLKRAGLESLAQRLPLDLSGGEKKRISLLRSLIFNAPLLILDEPFSDLDKDNRFLFKDWLQSLLIDHKGVLIYVTHHESDVENLANLRFDWPTTPPNILDFSKAKKI